MIPPGGSALRAEMHRNSLIHLRDLRVPMGHPAIEEDLSNLVNKIGESGSENHMERASGRGVATKPKRLKRKAVTVAQVHAPIDGRVRDLDFMPQTSERKRSRRSLGASAELVVDDHAVPNINDVRSWGDGLIESWDACAFSQVPKETQRGDQSNGRVVSVADSDPEALPSNQEVYRRGSHPIIDNQHIRGLIQEGFNTIEGRFNTIEERINAIESRLNIVKERLDVFDTTATRYLD
ncbi:uncharacterized protein LOC127425887 [Myxocyprinus asiaticus]|uniref:uncharacterized protein LOC127425887 n=1 Tax=Myxocyprinus asiaticus TaxID=70543 RepID=UPI0022225D8F|nr:uncharacterized protein LOC127425887 [Myxocyprinus asiaticus]